MLLLHTLQCYYSTVHSIDSLRFIRLIDSFIPSFRLRKWMIMRAFFKLQGKLYFSPNEWIEWIKTRPPPCFCLTDWLDSTQLDSTRLNSTQLDSTQLNSTQLTDVLSKLNHNTTRHTKTHQPRGQKLLVN
jgi:hypothetical protein